MEIIHEETPEDAARSFIHPGLGVRPLHACSCSKAIAAFADPGFQSEVLTNPLCAYTESTKTEPEDIQQDFAHIRDRGFAECVEEIEVGVSSVAAPFASAVSAFPSASAQQVRFAASTKAIVKRSALA